MQNQVKKHNPNRCSYKIGDTNRATKTDVELVAHPRRFSFGNLKFSQTENEKIISNIQEIKSRKGKIIVITDSKNDKVLRELANDLIVVPKTNHYAFVIFASIVLQLLAYHIALGKKLNVDQPRNLAKSVSVE